VGMLLLGRVWTFDPARPRAGAVLVEGDLIRDVGPAEDLRARYPEARRVRASWITPGLHEAHVHPLQWGLALETLDLRGLEDPREVARRVREAVRAREPGTWLRGGGYVFDAYPGRALLDQAAPRHPVFLESRDLHAAWVNAAALERAGIDGTTPDPPGGKILRDAAGEPTGYLLERAVELVRASLEPPRKDDLLRGLQDLAARGFTAAHAMGEEDGAGTWAGELAQEGRLPLRLAWTQRPNENTYTKAQYVGEHLHVFGVKRFADGALTSRTAWMCAPYPEGGHGMPLDDPRDHDEEVARDLARGFTAVWHAIGTCAVREVVALIERLEARGLPARRRVRIEHAQHVADADLPRLAGLALSVQPQHAADDRRALERLGSARMGEAYRWGEFARLPGVRLLLGSDAPVAPPEPGRTLQLTRNHPLGGRGLDLAQALRAYTHEPAAVLGWSEGERPLGIVAPGARAELTLWDEAQPVARLWRGVLTSVMKSTRT